MTAAEPLRIANSAGSWATLTVRIQSPDADLKAPTPQDIARALAGIFGDPLLVDDAFLHHHDRWVVLPAEQPPIADRVEDVEWAHAYARTYWMHGQEPKSQRALTVLSREVARLEESLDDARRGDDR